MKSSRGLMALLILVAFALTAAGAAPKPPPLPDRFDVDAIDAWLGAQARHGRRVGLSVAIAREGRIVLARGYGEADGGAGTPVTPTTLMPIGSVSKQFTCAAVLLLAEDGKLAVTDPVAKYYPELTRATDITLLDLMNHVSGYPDYYPLDFLDRRMKAAIAPDDLLRRYAGGRLDFEPGTRFSYSNTGFILLGRVVERVSGQSLGEFLDRRIFGPLGMSHTRYEPGAGEASMARGYTTFALSAPEPVPPEAVGWLGGAGAIASTPSDLIVWDLALADGKVLKPGSWATMTRPRELADGRLSLYGCGVGVRVQDGRQVVVHSGAVSGFNAYNAVIPSTRSALALIGNMDGALGDIPAPLLGLLLKEESRVPVVNGPTATDKAKALFADYQRGRVDRRGFAEEFNVFLDDARLAAAAKRLKPYGRPTKSELVSANERGGMEVSVVRLTFPKATLRTLMYRRPDGIVEQFFVDSE